ncbi:MAG: flagellar motor switch protein FliN [Planctomycetes bacterium]|nr:flagellar motor switch protein FliN [Planctomycetota bacterium]
MAETKPKIEKGPAAKPVSDTEKLVQDALAEAQGAVDRLKTQADGPAAPAQPAGIELLSDVDLHVTIELGRTQMLVEDVLKLNEGSVVELDKLAGDPVDVYVNQRLVARGEVLVLNDSFCIRISEIVADLEEQAEEAALDLNSKPQA